MVWLMGLKRLVNYSKLQENRLFSPPKAINTDPLARGTAVVLTVVVHGIAHWGISLYFF